MNKRSILLMAPLLLTTVFSSFAQQTGLVSFERNTGNKEVQPAWNSKSPYSFDLRTNLLYDVMLTPTLGAEWHINRTWGIKVDGSYSHRGSDTGPVQNLWLVSPEIRWYIGNAEGLYLGAGGNAGRYNLYKGVIGNLFFPDETGYQGSLYGGNLSVGYKLALSRAFLLDFNLGLGYTRFKYDVFTVTDGVRVYKEIKEKDVTTNRWGLAQAGVSLVWKLGGDKR